MSGGATLLITLGVAFAGLSVLYVVYYMTSISSSVYDVRVQLRRELQAKEEQIRELIDTGLKQRGDWARAEADENVQALRADLLEEQAEYRREMTRTLEKIAREVAALKVAIDSRPVQTPTATPEEPQISASGRPQGRA